MIVAVEAADDQYPERSIYGGSLIALPSGSSQSDPSARRGLAREFVSHGTAVDGATETTLRVTTHRPVMSKYPVATSAVSCWGDSPFGCIAPHTSHNR